MGLALFNTPTLLGGQAARAGLSCASCHVNGRDNAHFLLPSLSGAPGTADVTSSFFGIARGNGHHDPVTIPDLAQPGKVSRAPGDQALPIFIRNLIVDEFSGAEPSASTLLALTQYVRAVAPCAGGDDRPQKRQLNDQLTLIRAAVESAAAEVRGGPAATGSVGEGAAVPLLIAGARHQLGLIAERYAAKSLAGERRMLLQASTRLRAISDHQDSAVFAAALDRWRQDFDGKIAPRLAAREASSLYNENAVAAFLAEKN